MVVGPGPGPRRLNRLPLLVPLWTWTNPVSSGRLLARPPDLCVDPSRCAQGPVGPAVRWGRVCPLERANHQREPVQVGMLAPVLLDGLAEEPGACQAQADSL